MAEGARKHHVFISYATADKKVADRVLAALEGAGIPCWIAPRDITPGPDYPAKIIRAISGSRIFVLIYSERSCESSFVPLELERAVSRKLRVIPFKLTAEPPPERLELLLAMSHWLDAYTPPLEGHIERLVATVREALRELGAAPEPPAPSTAAPAGRAGRVPRRRRWMVPLAIALLACCTLAWALGAFSRFTADPSRAPGRTLPAAAADSAGRGTDLGADGDQAGGRRGRGAETVMPPSQRVDGSVPGALESSGRGGAPTPGAPESSGPAGAAAFGSLHVTSSPVPATVWLDGQRMGRTPLSLPRVAAGTHSIELTHEEFEPYGSGVEVEPGLRATLNAVLVPLEAEIRVTSTPDGASVSLSGEARGVTPCTLRRVRVGRHDLVIEKEGYERHAAEVSVVPQGENQVHADLRLLASALRVRVIPSGLIYIDGERKTEDTNATYATELVPGSYEVTGLSLTWGRWVKRVVMDGRLDREIVFDFSREHRVTVTSDPPAAKIYVNDVFAGKYTPSVLALRPGGRKIEVRREGFEMRGAAVEIMLEEDLAEPLAFTLTPLPGR